MPKRDIIKNDQEMEDLLKSTVGQNREESMPNAVEGQDEDLFADLDRNSQDKANQDTKDANALAEKDIDEQMNAQQNEEELFSDLDRNTNPEKQEEETKEE